MSSQTMAEVKKRGEKKRRGGGVKVKHVDPISPPEPSPIIPAQDRETRIDFTLDMVLNDLIQQGHISPAKSYLFKTQEMKEHIGKMCDRVHRIKNGFPERDPWMTPPKAVTAIGQPFEYPSEVNQDPPTLTLKKKGSKVKKQQEHDGGTSTTTTKAAKKPSRKRSNSKTRKEKGVQPLLKAPKVKVGKKKGGALALALAEMPEAGATSGGVFDVDDSSILQVEPIDHLLMKTPIYFPGGAFQRMNEKFDPERFTRTADVQTYRATVDLRGFGDNHIALELDGRRLIIVAQRPQNEELKLHARKVIEIIDIPEGITLTNLKIGRGSDGSLLVEEYENV